jgi:SNF2 family DNA or RNA helicase
MAVENAPLDLFAQCRFLGAHLLGFASYYAFRAHYAYLQEMTNAARSFKVVVGYKNMEDLKGRLSRFSSILKTEDCLDLPSQSWETYEVELTPEQKRMYTQMKEHAVAELENADAVTAPIVLTRLLRLHQIVCGFITDDDGTVHEVPNNRLQALDAVLDETDSVIIWANYRYNIKAIVKHLSEKHGPDSVVHYFGDTTADEREEAKAKFQSGKVKYFVGNQQTAGYGLTLTRANVAVYFSNNYNLGLRAQSEKRCHRIGQSRAVTYVDLVTPGTVDRKILQSLRSKRALSDKILVTNYEELF